MKRSQTSVVELEFPVRPTAGELLSEVAKLVASGMLGAIIHRLSGDISRSGSRTKATLGGRLDRFAITSELQAHKSNLIIGRAPGATRTEDVETTILYQDHFFFGAECQNVVVRRRQIAAKPNGWGRSLVLAVRLTSFTWSALICGVAFQSQVGLGANRIQ